MITSKSNFKLQLRKVGETDPWVYCVHLQLQVKQQLSTAVIASSLLKLSVKSIYNLLASISVNTKGLGKNLS